MEELPANASEAPTDKIYATGDSVVYYKKMDDTLKAATPDFEGYTKKICSKKFLGNLKMSMLTQSIWSRPSQKRKRKTS